MDTKEKIKKLDSVISCLMAHPDNEPNSEFADRIDDLIEIKNSLTTPEEDKEENIHPHHEDLIKIGKEILDAVDNNSTPSRRTIIGLRLLLKK